MTDRRKREVHGAGSKSAKKNCSRERDNDKSKKTGAAAVSHSRSEHEIEDGEKTDRSMPIRRWEPARQTFEFLSFITRRCTGFVSG